MSPGRLNTAAPPSPPPAPTGQIPAATTAAAKTAGHPVASTARSLNDARAQLGRQGWTVLTDMPFLREGEADERAVLDLASLFGRPSARDGGRAVWPVAVRPDRRGGTISTRIGAAAFHTDAQYRDEPEDYVCLFAVRPAADGGISRLLAVDDAVRAVRRLRDGASVCALMRRPVWCWITPAEFGHCDSAAGATEGMTPAAVLSPDGGIRWRGDNLSPRADRIAVRTAARIDAAFAAAPEAVEVPLQRGDVLIADNRRVLHARTAFSDERRMLLRVRLWRES